MNSPVYFIAAPFGNYLKFNNINSYKKITSVTGTWTLKRRAGLIKRLWKIASTLRYDSNLKGWTNRLGLPNEGIEHGIKKTSLDEVLSIAAIEKDDWLKLNDIIENKISLEINLSCPNVEHTDVVWKDLSIFSKKNKRKWCIVKVSPLTSPIQLEFLIEKAGFKQFHLCNTLPLKTGGGLSGPALKPYVLNMIQTIRDRWGDDLEIIAGGGIKNKNDVADYLIAGANHVSLGSICFNPWKLNKIIKL